MIGPVPAVLLENFEVVAQIPLRIRRPADHAELPDIHPHIMLQLEFTGRGELPLQPFLVPEAAAGVAVGARPAQVGLQISFRQIGVFKRADPLVCIGVRLVVVNRVDQPVAFQLQKVPEAPAESARSRLDHDLMHGVDPPDPVDQRLRPERPLFRI